MMSFTFGSITFEIEEYPPKLRIHEHQIDKLVFEQTKTPQGQWVDTLSPPVEDWIESVLLSWLERTTGKNRFDLEPMIKAAAERHDNPIQQLVDEGMSQLDDVTKAAITVSIEDAKAAITASIDEAKLAIQSLVDTAQNQAQEVTEKYSRIDSKVNKFGDILDGVSEALSADSITELVDRKVTEELERRLNTIQNLHAAALDLNEVSG